MTPREELISDIRKEIDETKDYPEAKERKKLMRLTPRVYAAYFGRKYLLPKYRAPHYFRQEFLNFVEWAGVQYFPLGDSKDEIVRSVFAASIIALRHRRPTLFLEQELGEALIRTPLPLDMMAEDIKWKWPGFRVYLPKRLVTIQRDGYDHSLMFMDIAFMDSSSAGHSVPSEFRAELDLYLDRELKEQNFVRFSEFRFFYPEVAMIMAGMIENGPDRTGLTTYAQVKPFTKYTLGYLTQIAGDLNSDWKQDDLDKAFMKKMEVLAVNVLLFLSAYPLEYAPIEQAIRKPRLEGKHQIPGLYPAKFVGQSQLRPEHHAAHHIARAVTGEEWHMRRHWKAGHWKRQVFGPKRGDRKLIWINPYEAGLEAEEEEAKKQ